MLLFEPVQRDRESHKLMHGRMLLNRKREKKKKKEEKKRTMRGRIEKREEICKKHLLIL